MVFGHLKIKIKTKINTKLKLDKYLKIIMTFHLKIYFILDINSYNSSLNHVYGN